MVKIPEHVIDEFRYLLVEDDDWYNTVVNNFVHDMVAKGIHTSEDDVQFSGFFNAGSGASFTGHVDPRVFFLEHPQLREQYPSHASLMSTKPGAFDYLHIDIYRMGQFSHEYSMYVDITVEDLEGVYDESIPLMRYARKQFEQRLSAERDGFHYAVLDTLRDYARGLFDALAAEYEYLTSDQVVAENIQANELWEPAA